MEKAETIMKKIEIESENIKIDHQENEFIRKKIQDPVEIHNEFLGGKNDPLSEKLNELANLNTEAMKILTKKSGKYLNLANIYTYLLVNKKSDLMKSKSYFFRAKHGLVEVPGRTCW